MGNNQIIGECPPGYVQTGNEVRCGRSGTETLCLDYPVCEPDDTLRQKSADLKKLLEGAPKLPESGGKAGGAKRE